VRITVGHLYPGYLNIYADRGNIAVLTRRAALRGHALHVTGVEPGDPLDPSAFDLLYVGGGQDREQALIAPDLARRGDDARVAVHLLAEQLAGHLHAFPLRHHAVDGHEHGLLEALGLGQHLGQPLQPGDAPRLPVAARGLRRRERGQGREQDREQHPSASAHVEPSRATLGRPQ